LDKDTREKIFLETKSGYKRVKKFISDDSRIGDFMGGKATDDLLINPGAASQEMINAYNEGIIISKDTRNLRKYFWEVDMSKPGNEFGVEIEEEVIQM